MGLDALEHAGFDERAAELPHRMHRSDWHRPHGILQCQTAISRLGLIGKNLLKLHMRAKALKAPVVRSHAMIKEQLVARIGIHWAG